MTLPKWKEISGFFIFSMIFVANVAFAQKNDYPASQVVRRSPRPAGKPVIRQGIYVPGNYSYQQMAFTCQSEWRLEKLTGLPLRFRIGDIDRLDAWEGKPNRGIGLPRQASRRWP